MFDLAMKAVRAAVDAALTAPLDSSSSNELLTFLAGVDVELNRLGAVQRRVICELDQRGVAGEAGSRSTKDVVAEVLRLSPYEARNRVHAAQTFGPRRALNGEPLEPVVPLVAAEVDTGTISIAHARVISDLLDALPGDIEAEFGIEVQEFLLAQARQVDPPTLAKLAVRLRDTLDQDGAKDRERRQQARRAFHLIRFADGSSKPSGYFTPAQTTAWLTILDALSKPQVSELGEPDTRTYAERMHDALFECALRLLRSGELPATGGTPTTITVTMTLDQLRAASGVTTNSFGDLLPVSELMKLAVEAEIIPVVLDDLGGVLAYGRTRRFAPPGLRRALAARDKGCAMPGCTRGASWTEAHHVQDWLHLGETEHDNLVLLCCYDHDTFEERGWKIEMIDGVPWFTPPPWLDPDQRPRRNSAHDQMLMELPASLSISPARV